MRRKILVFLSILGLLFVSGRDANALIKYLGELSGPGPFYGLDFVFPWSLSTPNLDSTANNSNIRLLNSLGVNTVWLSSEVSSKGRFNFAEPALDINRAHQRLLEQEFRIVFVPVAVAAVRQNQEPAAERSLPSLSEDSFLDATQLSKNSPVYQLLSSFLGEKELEEFTKSKESADSQKRLQNLNKALLQILTDSLRRNLKNYGLTSVGLFNSQLAVPQIRSEEGNEINNLFFALSLGFAFASENNIPHPADFTGDKDVIWLSFYPALEWRFYSFADGDGSIFVNVGPAINYFVGAQFDDFVNVSFRTRIGVQFWRLYGGFELNVFSNTLRNDQFGGLNDPSELDRATAGAFLSIDLSSHPRKPPG